MGRLASTVAGVCLVLMGFGCAQPFRSHGVDTLRQLKLDPDARKGILYAFRGTVIDSQFTPGQGTTVQVMVDDDRFPELVYVVYRFSDPVSAVNNDYVAVMGKVDGRVEGINGFGGVSTGLKLDGVAFHGPHSNEWDPSYTVQYKMWESDTLWQTAAAK